MRLVVWRLWTEGEHLGESNFRVSSFLVSSMPDLLSATKPKPLYTTSTVDTSGGPPGGPPGAAENATGGLAPPGGVSTEEAGLSTSSTSSLQGSQDLAGDMSELSLARKNLDVMQRTKSGIKVSSPHFASSNPTSAVSSPLNSGMGTVRDRDGKVVEKVASGFASFKRNPAQHRKRYGACHCWRALVCSPLRPFVDAGVIFTLLFFRAVCL